MGNKKQVQTIRKVYGKKFFEEQGRIGGRIGGARPFKDPDIARLAQKKSVETRLRKKREREEAKNKEG
jgi:hypothetical protein